jgi:hypothetical protein
MEIQTQIVFVSDAGNRVVFRGQFAAVTDAADLDMSVLGRDITNLFAVVVDRPGNLVCLLGQQHCYVIQSG